MKAFFSLLCLALVAKIALSATVEPSEPASQEAFNAVKKLVADQKNLVEAVLKDMPTTESYAPYRATWENFLKSYTSTEDNEVCFERLMRLMNGFSDLFPKYPKASAPNEEKTIWRLFDQHGVSDFFANSRSVFASANENHIEFASNRDKC
ncbi:uncharacterized protein LOC142236643 [Haematobia irritans]|uniref:uncharacterized protein LOC142236643 n=1 Tax=Haematobia irritans TaxID=7368 RepID=UPI003F4F612C